MKSTKVRCIVRAFNDELLPHDCLVSASGRVQVYDTVIEDWTSNHNLSDADLKKIRAAAKAVR
jgi:hypothetical protein